MLRHKNTEIVFKTFITAKQDYAIELALEAILGHKSAHSLATGPVIAEPEDKKKRITETILAVGY